MKVDINLKKKDNENERQYLWRINNLIKAGKIENFKQVTPIINQEWRADESEYRDESAYRKPVQYAEKFYEDVFLPMMQENKCAEDSYFKELQILKDEVYKAKRQLFDQRREYNKLLTMDARADHLTENLIQAAQSLNSTKFLDTTKEILSYREKEAVLALSDWHYGMVTENIWNKFNIEICKQRVSNLKDKVVSYLKFHKPRKLNVLILGDVIHGSIHTGCRVASEEETSDQLMQVSEIIAELVAELSKYTSETVVYSTYGNHARTIQNKQDSVHSDNMEKIIPWWLRQRFQNDETIQVVDSAFYEFIHLNVCGYNIVATHGDLDKIKNLGVTVNTLFTKLYNTTIDYTISGDKHHLEEFESFDIENILVRSLCGADDYSNDHRLYSNAGQTLMFFTEEDGRECTYNIKFVS